MPPERPERGDHAAAKLGDRLRFFIRLEIRIPYPREGLPVDDRELLLLPGSREDARERLEHVHVDRRLSRELAERGLGIGEPAGLDLAPGQVQREALAIVPLRLVDRGAVEPRRLLRLPDAPEVAGGLLEDANVRRMLCRELLEDLHRVVAPILLVVQRGELQARLDALALVACLLRYPRERVPLALRRTPRAEAISTPPR